MNKDEIIKIIEEILKKKLLIDIDINESMVDKKLLGGSFNLLARDLIHLYFEVENAFNINLPKNEIIMGGFSTVDSIANLVLNELKCKNINANVNSL